MTTQEAIDLVVSIKKVCTGIFPPDEQTALSLAIKALKEKLAREKRSVK